MSRIERHNVRVLEPGERQVLLAAGGTQLEHDVPIAERRLPGEKDLGVRALAERREDVKLAERLVVRWECRRSELRPQDALTIEQHFDLRPPAGESHREFGSVDRL